MDHDGHPLAITAADAVAASGVPPWNWRETPGNGKPSDVKFLSLLCARLPRREEKTTEKRELCIVVVYMTGFLNDRLFFYLSFCFLINVLYLCQRHKLMFYEQLL